MTTRHDHHANEIVVGVVGDAAVAGGYAILQHREGVADFAHFIELVGNEQDGRTLRLELADKGEQSFGFHRSQRRRRLVHDEHADVLHQRFGDFDDLAVGDRHFANRLVEIQAAKTEPVDDRPRFRFHHLPVDDRNAEPALHGKAADEQIFERRQLVDDGQFLVDDRNAGVARFARRHQGVRHTVEHDLAASRLVNPGENFHQRRFAGTVLAEEDVNLAGMDVEIDALQHRNVVEMLFYADHADDRGDRFGAGWIGCVLSQV